MKQARSHAPRKNVPGPEKVESERIKPTQCAPGRITEEKKIREHPAN